MAAYNAIIGIMLLLLFLLLSYLIANYVVRALALYKLAQQRGNRRPWLAFLPIADSYLLGKIGDDIHAQYRKSTRRRALLPLLRGAYLAFSVTYYCIYFPLMSDVYNYSDRALTSSQIMRSTWNPLWLDRSKGLLILAISLLMLAASIVYTVFEYLCLHSVFREYAPEKASNYLIFSLLFQFLLSAPLAAGAVILVIYRKTPQFELLNRPRAPQPGEPPSSTQPQPQVWR